MNSTTVRCQARAVGLESAQQLQIVLVARGRKAKSHGIIGCYIYMHTYIIICKKIRTIFNLLELSTTVSTEYSTILQDLPVQDKWARGLTGSLWTVVYSVCQTSVCSTCLSAHSTILIGPDNELLLELGIPKNYIPIWVLSIWILCILSFCSS